MGQAVASVVVDVLSDTLTEPFSYLIPDELLEHLQIGSCVLAPFGPKEVIGYIAGFGGDYAGRLRPISAVLEPEPAFDESLLSLASWMASRYHCGLAEALRCIVPWPMATSIRTQIQLLQPPPESTQLSILSRQAVSLLLGAGGALDSHDLRDKLRVRDLSPALRPLRDGGWITETRSIRPPKARVKTVRGVQLLLSPEMALVEAEKLPRAPKQQSVLRVLASRPDEVVPVSELGDAVGAIGALAKRGWIAVRQVEMRRNPWRWDASRQDALNPTPDQKRGLLTIRAALGMRAPRPILIHGITASGKTEVYMRAIEETLKGGRAAIVLVPEISLTAQVLDTFKGRFGDDVAVLHSKLSVGERYDEWKRIRRGEARVVLGARSGIFAPVPNLGLIILDEEHEHSYKQDSTPRYHTREAAIERARDTGALLLLGSATPSIESYYRAKQGEFDLLEMPSRIDDRPLPTVQIVDLREEFAKGRRSVFSARLREAIADRLERGEQTILFLNRRGFSTILLCRECGYVARCPHCSVSLTLHAAIRSLKCHHCGYQREAPEVCPACQSTQIRHFGIGTEKVEEETRVAFPEARVLRMDRDTTRAKDAHVLIHRSFLGGEADILIGTQMVAKGFDFPKVTLVGVITADTALNMPDFRAAERAFQLLTQVSGRAGRGETPGEVVIQTFDPDHYSVQAAITQDYGSFYEQEIENRREPAYPPFAYLVNCIAIDEDERAAKEKIESLAEQLQEIASALGAGIELLGPAPAPLAKLKGRYRWHLLLRAPDRGALEELVREVGRRHHHALQGITVDVDPQSLL